MIRRIPFAAAFAALITLTSCSGGERSRANARQPDGAMPDSIPRVEVASARASVTGPATYPSYLEAERQAELVAETAGQVLELRVREGDWVNAGDTLLVIDDRDERLALKRDEAEWAWARAQVERAQSLLDSGHVSEREAEDARLACDRAEAALGLSRAALARCTVRAPIRGLVWMVRVEPLRHVTEDQPLLRVTNPSRLRASVYLPATLRPSVRPGMPVRLEPARGGATIDAVVARIDPLTDPVSGSFKVVAACRGPVRDVEVGSELRFILPGVDPGFASLVPERTLIGSDGAQTWIWRLEGDRAHRTPVRLGAVRANAIEVEEGLKPGTTIVIGASRELTEGGRVLIEPKAP